MVNKDLDRLSTTPCAQRSDAARHPGAAGAGRKRGGELAQPFDMTLPAISKHPEGAERAGLIARGREA